MGLGVRGKMGMEEKEPNNDMTDLETLTARFALLLSEKDAEIAGLQAALTDKLSCFCDHCPCECIACKDCGVKVDQVTEAHDG